MPLIPGRGHVGDNIKEFRTGPTYAHTAGKFGHDRAEKQALAVSLNEQDKDGEHSRPRSHHSAPHHSPPASDHQAAIAKMHPEHLHRLVQEAHAGKYGPQAQQTAQQAMEAPAAPAGPQGPPQGQPAVPPRGAMFGGGGMGEPDQDDMGPPNRAAMFAGSRGGM